MAMERQTTYGWCVAVDLFLSGTGAGVFLISFILTILDRYQPITRIGAIVGVLLVLIGALFLVADITVRRRLYRLFSNSASWASRGTWILTIFIIFGLGYSLPSFSSFMWLPWSGATTLVLAIGIIAALFSLLVLTYPGFLFAVMKSIPFWNTPALPILFLLSGLCTGVAALLLATPFFIASMSEETASALHTFGIIGIFLLLAHLLVLWGYLEIASHSSVASAESVRLLKSPLFILGVMIAGLVIPLGLLSYASVVAQIQGLSILAIASGILLLAGGLYLRYSLIKVGIYVPRFSI